MENDFRNILSVWLGSYFSQKRKRLDVAVEDMVAKMSLSLPYLRQVENGLTNLSPARVFDVQNGMNELFGLQVNFSSLSDFLVAIQYLSSRNDSIAMAKSAVKKLGDANAGLFKLLINLNEPAWDLLQRGNYEELKQFFAQPHFIRELELYLVDTSFSLPKVQGITKKWEDMFNETPSVWNQLIFSDFENLKKQLTALKTSIPYFDLHRWETEIINDKKRSIKAGKGVLSSIDMLIDYAGDFDWYYLMRKHFNLNCYIIKDYSEGDRDEAYKNIVNKIGENIEITTAEVESALKINHLNESAAKSLISGLGWSTEAAEGAQLECWIYQVEVEEDSGSYLTEIGFEYLYKPIPKDSKNSDEAYEYIRQLQISRYTSLSNEKVRIANEILKKNEH